MPLAVFKSVREVNSEDAKHRAQNLLHEQQYGKYWKTKAPGVKMAKVVLEFDQERKITGIDIGNCHSAFVQVQVGQTLECEFTDILLTCSLMTPSESKSSASPDRVRCFAEEALVPSAVEKSWRLLKIICTQPFNTHVPYGLSFIKVHVKGEIMQTQPKLLVPPQFLQKPQTTVTAAPKCGQFSLNLREDSPDSDSGMFNRWKTERTTAAAIRDAAKLEDQQRQTNDTKDAEPPKILDRNREKLLFGDDDEPTTTANAKYKRLQKHLEMDKARYKRETDDMSKKHESTQKRKSLEDRPATAMAVHHEDTPDRLKRRSSPNTSKPAKKPKTVETNPTKQYRPLKQLLQGVVFVISGLQNPDRGDLRNKAVALGAKYRADWSDDCTHLICAFKNTPKYNQVKKTKGNIVRHVWVEECYTQKKYLPWRRFALDRNAQALSESDEEIYDAATKPVDNTNGYSSNNNTSEVIDPQMALDLPSGSDTDDEIQRVVSKNAAPSGKSADDVYDATTEEEVC